MTSEGGWRPSPRSWPTWPSPGCGSRSTPAATSSPSTNAASPEPAEPSRRLPPSSASPTTLLDDIGIGSRSLCRRERVEVADQLVEPAEREAVEAQGDAGEVDVVVVGDLRRQRAGA